MLFGNQAILRRFLFELPNLIGAAQGDNPSLQRRDSDASGKRSVAQTAAWNILIYLREKKNEADSRAIRFLKDSYRRLTERQRQELWRAIHAKRGRPPRDLDHENVTVGYDETARFDESDIETLVAGLSNLTGCQLRRLSKIISSRTGRPSLAAAGQEQQIKIGARAHQLIEERREARRGQGPRLLGDGPYETVMADATKKFGYSSRNLARAYKEFRWRQKQGIVDDNGNYLDSQPFDGKFGEIKWS